MEKQNPIFSEYIPTRLYFGCGEIKRLATEPLPGRKALIVISAGTSMRRFGYLDKVTEGLQAQGTEYVVYDKILPNPIKEHVMEATGICRTEGCDFVIGLGGGSSIDSAKSIALMAKNPGDYWDYIHGGSGKGQPVTGGALPIIAIPTTAGTGTEADPWTVITHNNEKIGFGTSDTFPLFSIVDPELMLSIPAKLTAYQGFDAFFHAAEGYIATCATPISRIYSLKAIELLARYLPTAVADGSNIEARTQVALGSMLAGMVESVSSCTSEHSLEHAMSGYFPALPHGAGLISVSNAYYDCFVSDVPELYANMAKAMTGKADATAADFATAFSDMQKACGVDNIKMSDWGITPDDLPRIAANARATMGGLFQFDPHPVSDEEVLAIFQKSFR